MIILKLRSKEQEMTYKYFLGLGSNIDPRIDYLKKACSHLSESGSILQKSGLYQTQAWGNRDQADFYNAIIEFESSLSPQKLLKKIKNIEIFIGRQQTSPWGPREVDIDIILCRECEVDEPDLKIPHPYFDQRRFVLIPLAELDNNIRTSPHNQSISELLDTCMDQSYIQKIESVW